jgi:ABC-type iron transport system FetAB ATPase subunit
MSLPGDAAPSAAPLLLQLRALQSAHAGPISLDLAAGECVAIRGASGSGKSVFLRMVADLDPHRGEALLDGARCGSVPAPHWRARVLYHAAEPAWWAPTVAEHFSPDQLAHARPLLPQVGLDPQLMDAEVERLSTGERQRLALLRSLSRRPKVLLLDEPTASLDSESVLAVEALLRAQLRNGAGMLLVTHADEQAQRLASRQFRMRDGRLEAQ